MGGGGDRDRSGPDGNYLSPRARAIGTTETRGCAVVERDRSHRARAAISNDRERISTPGVRAVRANAGRRRARFRSPARGRER